MAGESERIEYAEGARVCTSIEDAGREIDVEFGLLERNAVGATR